MGGEAARGKTDNRLRALLRHSLSKDVSARFEQQLARQVQSAVANP